MYLILKKHENGQLQVVVDSLDVDIDVVTKKAEEITKNNGSNYYVAKLLFELSKQVIVDKKEL